MKIKTLTVAILISLMLPLVSCKDSNSKVKITRQITSVLQDTDYRPNFHFTPEKNWMNDPNGMFYLDGTYHLFYQHYPEGNTWGPMHWGHATSEDMIEWDHKPIALYPDEKGYIFSGSSVVDKNNSSGFGDGTNVPIIALFTYHDPEGEKEGRNDFQTQGLAYSIDQGKTWTKYKNNPVIKNPGIKDFRDPNMVWDEVHKQWILVLATYEKALFYSSKNLIDWTYISDFGEGIGAHGGVWECPDFIKMKVAGTDKEKWVLIQSLNPGGYNGGSGTQYFVGDFDGKKFIPEPYTISLEDEHDFWLDFGKDNYAGVTWNNAPNGRTVFIGWMSNWLYANVVPTETWRSTTTIARELKLIKLDGKYRIASTPVKELNKYIGSSIDKDEMTVSSENAILTSDEISLSKTEISFEIPALEAKDYQFLLTNVIGDSLTFGYDHSQKQFYLDRSKSGVVDFSGHFAEKLSIAPRISNNKNLKVSILLDKTSMELFFDDGTTVMTEIIFPKNPFQEFKAQTDDSFTISNLKANQLEL